MLKFIINRAGPNSSNLPHSLIIVVIRQVNLILLLAFLVDELVILELQILELRADLLPGIGLSGFDRVALPLFVFDLGLQLVHDLLVLHYHSVLLLHLLVHLSFQVGVLSLETLAQSLVGVTLLG